MSIKYTNILNCKTLQNVSQFAIFGLKINHLATLAGLANSAKRFVFLAERSTIRWLDALAAKLRQGAIEPGSSNKTLF
jgi:hypothetical protein